VQTVEDRRAGVAGPFRSPFQPPPGFLRLHPVHRTGKACVTFFFAFLPARWPGSPCPLPNQVLRPFPRPGRQGGPAVSPFTSTIDSELLQMECPAPGQSCERPSNSREKNPARFDLPRPCHSLPPPRRSASPPIHPRSARAIVRLIDCHDHTVAKGRLCLWRRQRSPEPHGRQPGVRFRGRTRPRPGKMVERGFFSTRPAPGRVPNTPFSKDRVAVEPFSTARGRLE